MQKRIGIGTYLRHYSLILFVINICLGFSLFHPDAWAAHLIKIGMKAEPKTLNYWLASDRWSRRVLAQIYNPLYYTDPVTLKSVPWLAESAPQYDEKTLSYTVRLRAAKWSDGTPFTSEDVAFTGNLIKEFKVPGRNPYWKFIEKIETPDNRTVRFYLKQHMAVFESRTLTTGIVQKKEWEGVVKKARASKKPLTTLRKYKVKKPVGTGPFVFKEWRQGSYLYLERNKHFFGKGLTIQGRKLGPYIDGIIFKFYGTSDAAVLAIKKGDIDMYWWQIEPGYQEELNNDPDIEMFYNERSALYYMGTNVRKKPFNDPSFRRAVATLIDKDFIITRLLQGQGVKMHSIIPSTNRFWYNPDIPKYGEGLPKKERIRKAHEILKVAGYTWKRPPVDGSGNIVKGKAINYPDGSPMEKITMLTPQADYDPARAMAGVIIQGWLKEIGIPISAKPMAIGALIEQTKVKRDFDAFILGYGRLRLDPDYLRKFFHSSQDKVRGQNRSGYRNPEFDRIADQSAKTMDRELRKKLVWDMQKIIMDDVPWIPLYNPKLIEAVRKGKYTGWVSALEGIGNYWSFCQIKPE